MLGYDKSPPWDQRPLRRGLPLRSLKHERVAYHEAGHALMGRVQGLPLDFIAGMGIIPNNKPGGLVVNGRCRTATSARHIAQDAQDPEIKLGAIAVDMLTFMGGLAAERRYLGIVDEETALLGADDDALLGADSDYNKIIRMAFDAIGPNPTREQRAEAIADIINLQKLANAIVGDHWPVVQKIAEGLLHDDFLSGSAVDKLIEEDPMLTANCLERYREYARDQKPSRDQFGRETPTGFHSSRDQAGVPASAYSGGGGAMPADQFSPSPSVATDPPVSEPQARAMYAAAFGHSDLGIPKSVGKEFVGAGRDQEQPQDFHSSPGNPTPQGLTPNQQYNDDLEAGSSFPNLHYDQQFLTDLAAGRVSKDDLDKRCKDAMARVRARDNLPSAGLPAGADQPRFLPAICSVLQQLGYSGDDVMAYLMRLCAEEENGAADVGGPHSFAGMPMPGGKKYGQDQQQVFDAIYPLDPNVAKIAQDQQSYRAPPRSYESVTTEVPAGLERIGIV
jgi:hypothetical protein